MLTLAPSIEADEPRAAAPARVARVAGASVLPVLAISSNLAQASSRLRVEALIAPLAARGFDVRLVDCPRRWTGRRDLLRSAADYHAVILQRKLLDPWNW